MIRKQLGNCPTAAYPLPLFSRGHVHKTSNMWGTLQYRVPHLLMVHMLIELRRTEQEQVEQTSAIVVTR